MGNRKKGAMSRLRPQVVGTCPGAGCKWSSAGPRGRHLPGCVLLGSCTEGPAPGLGRRLACFGLAGGSGDCSVARLVVSDVSGKTRSRWVTCLMVYPWPTWPEGSAIEPPLL